MDGICLVDPRSGNEALSPEITDDMIWNDDAYAGIRLPRLRGADWDFWDELLRNVDRLPKLVPVESDPCAHEFEERRRNVYIPTILFASVQL